MSRKNQHRGHSTLVAFSWLAEYAAIREAENSAEYSTSQEVAYNMGRGYHHLGLLHLAAPWYAKALLAASPGGGGEAAGDAAAASASASVPPGSSWSHAELSGGGMRDGQEVTREAAHNLARICHASGSKALCRQIVRKYMTID